MKTFNEFINESLRDKMVGKPIEIAINNIFKNDKYDDILDNAENYFYTTDANMMYPDIFYFSIIKKMDFDIIKKNISDVIQSVFTKDGKPTWMSDAIKKFKPEINNLESLEGLQHLIFEIDDVVGDVYFRDEILRQLIKKQDIKKTKNDIIDLIKN